MDKTAFSFWELSQWFSDVDHTVIGSGIVGLHAALRLRERFPEDKILVLERGLLPQGASTKNAGFACFGSLSEILDDLSTHTESEVLDLIARRWQGLQKLRQNLGDAAIDFRPYGGYELFLEKDRPAYEHCLSRMAYVNDLLRPLFKSDVFSIDHNRFGFAGICEQLIFNRFEGQIDTGKMMQALLRKAVSENIMVLNQASVTEFHENGDHVSVSLGNLQFRTKNLLLATNGFSSNIIPEVKPARAQVFITEPVADLPFKGSFHLDRGYYYFRNVGSRVLFGGGRNLDFQGETTTTFGNTEIVQSRLDELLKTVILPGREISVAHRWSGIMGMGTHKNPIVRQLSEHVYCGVRLGGMGVAIGSLVGTELADLIQE